MNANIVKKSSFNIAFHSQIPGRKNYMFCGNDEAASRAAIMYSLIGSCKAMGVNPHKWLSFVLDNISDCNNMSTLLPEKFI